MRAFIGRLTHPEPGFDVNRASQTPDTDHGFFVPPIKVSFGPFRLLPMQLLFLEGEKPLPFGIRALEILPALLEHRGELISEQDLMARLWPKVLVEPANLTVHMSALRDGCARHRLIVDPGLAAT
ncbi:MULTISPECIES: winged helix-turn-helix domain-containing protein [Bradyrhizobium]|jgi:DNA-binding response OmpR family regulator|uniref:winged helix-turn-helix domain-containing protein n=1 Tax=Bradyrhizobium elkanii TaxID=29448 RepID=UPI0018AD43E8|nr:winged helix-turn-helix domain-containing protein [Bradyrhizobium elkanii]